MTQWRITYEYYCEIKFGETVTDVIDSVPEQIQFLYRGNWLMMPISVAHKALYGRPKENKAMIRPRRQSQLNQLINKSSLTQSEHSKLLKLLYCRNHRRKQAARKNHG